MTEINNRDRAVFEAGIKLGALYHQFVGTPINTDMLDGLARMIEESIGVQPFVRSISVIDRCEMVEKKQNPGIRILRTGRPHASCKFTGAL